jgi:hypothetical protein
LVLGFIPKTIMKNHLILLLVLISVLGTSCLKDVEELGNIKGVSASPTFSFPLVNAEATIADLVGKVSGNSHIITDDNKLLILVFDAKDSLPEKQYLTIPNVNAAIDLSMPAPAIPVFEATGLFNIEQNNTTPITISGNTRLERILVKDGIMSFNASSSFKHNVYIKLTYPGITKNGNALVDSFEFIYNGSIAPQVNRNINITGYEVDFTNNGSTYNVFPYQVKVDIIRNPANDVQSTDKISFSQNLSVSKYSRMEGYFGKFTIASFKETSVLGVFDKSIDGNVYVNDPKLKLSIENSFGLPITAKITDFYAVSGSGNIVPINVDLFKDTFTLEYTSSIGQSRTTNYIIDKNNSNIDEVLSSAPQEIVYEVTFYANNNDIIQTNVLYDYTTVKQTSEIELPFDLKIIKYTIETKGDFSMGNSFNNDSGSFFVNWAEVRSDFTSEMPLNAKIQVYLEDSVTQQVYDSIYNPYFLLAGCNVDANGEMVTPSNAVTTVMVDKDRLVNFKKANQYRLQINFSTSQDNNNSPFVKFYATDKLKLKLGVKANTTYITK